METDNLSAADLSTLEELKRSILSLCEGKGPSLPPEYASCVSNTTASIQDWDSHEKELVASAGEAVAHRYFICHFTSDINELLQSLHDAAEDRVVRGLHLDDNEVGFIADLTALYNMLFSDVYPAFLRQADGDVIAVRDPPPLTPQRERASRLVRSRTINTVMDGDIPSEIDSLLLTPEELATIRVCFMTRRNEQMLRVGLVVKTRKLSRKLRYLILTNYQLLYLENAEVCKGRVDLARVVRVSLVSQSAFDVVVKGRTYNFFSPEPQQWVDAITAALQPITTLLTAPIAPPRVPASAVASCDIVVFVGSAEELCQNAKNRPDNPYFYIGIGNPDAFHVADVQRFRSGRRTDTRCPSFADSFVLRWTSLHPLLLDLRVYSHVPTGNDFCYGVAHVALDELFTATDHTVQGWWPLRTCRGEEGRVYMRISLPAAAALTRLPALEPMVIPGLCAHRRFELRQNVPVVLSGERETVGLIHSPSEDVCMLVDASTKQRLYTLQRSSFFKREHTISDEHGLYARCYHKMKSFRKKKIRLVIASGELLFSLEGDFDNEVSIKNAIQEKVATLVVGSDKGGHDGRVLLLSILSSSVDAALLVVFCVYVLRTL